MKILFFTRRYLPHIGGVEKHISEVVKFLEKDDQVIIVTEQHDPSLPEHERIQNVEIWRIPLPAQQTHKTTIWLWLLKHFSLLLQADVIHIHDVFFWFLPFRLPLFWKHVFMTFHGYEAPGPPNIKQIFWHQVADVFSDGNICVGNFHQSSYGITPNFVMYGGVDNLSAFKKQLPKSTEKKIFFASRLDEDTGFRAYLYASLLLQKKDFLYHLDIYGDGALRKWGEEFSAHHNLAVTFHGFVEDVSQFLSGHDIAFASQYLSILQALAVNIKVISFANFDMKKRYLEETPFRDWITIASNPEEIADAVQRPQHIKDEAQLWVQQQTWQRVAEIYQKLWQKQ